MTVELKENVRLIMHLPGGYSRVLVESTAGVGLAGGDVHWDIPTETRMVKKLVPVTALSNNTLLNARR